MAHRATSLRYFGAKLAHAIELASSSATLPEAFAKGMEAYQRQLTSVMALAGAAMAPTFNPKPTDAAENLLLRLIPRPSARTVFSGDVVAFTSPLAAPVDPGVMVRRVTAVEGEEMVSDDPEDEGFHIPQGHCWVLADNPALEPPHVIDSRTFGPLPFSAILGRVMYSARSETNHGPVENSVQALAADAPVLEAELDLGRLLVPGGEGEGEGEGEQQ